MRTVFCRVDRMIVVGILIWFCFLSTAFAQQAGSSFTVQFTDSSGTPLAGVLLTAQRIDAPQPTASYRTGIDGRVTFPLSFGRYYFTGDVSLLKRNTSYTAGMTSAKETTLYFISRPADITPSSGIVNLTVDNINYIDIADIGGMKKFQFRISQRELGINTTVYAGSQHKLIRLFLPTRMVYAIQDNRKLNDVKRSVYAAPGMRFLISAY